MGCFDNYIGISDTDTASSNLWIRMLGITKSQSSGIANDHYATGEALLRDILKRSVEMVKDEIKEYLYPYFKVNTVLSEIRSGIYDTDKFLSQIAKNRGLKIEKTCYNSRLSKLYVKRISLLSSISALQVPVYIKDGTLTTTIKVDLVSNVPYELVLNYKAVNDIIYILADNTNVKMCSTDNPDNISICGCGHCNCISSSNYFFITGWDGAVNNSEMFGIIADVSMICDEDELMCLLANNIRFPVFWKIGIEAIREAQMTDRLNYYTLTQDAESLQQKFDYFEKKYTESMKLFSASVPALMNTLDKYCIQCNQTRYQESV